MPRRRRDWKKERAKAKKLDAKTKKRPSPVENNATRLDQDDAPHRKRKKPSSTSLHPEDELLAVTQTNPPFVDDPAALFWSAFVRTTPDWDDALRNTPSDAPRPATDALVLTSDAHFLPSALSSSPRLLSSLSRAPGQESLGDQQSEKDDLVSTLRTQTKNHTGAEGVTTLVVTRSAIRACDVLKRIAPLKTNVCKLFGKHLKATDQRRELASKKPTIAVGTPHRIAHVVEEWSALRTIFVDVSRDAHKGFSVLTMPGVSKDLFVTLFHAKLLTHVLKGSTKIVLFD